MRRLGRIVGSLASLWGIGLFAVWAGQHVLIYPFDPRPVSPRAAGVSAMTPHHLSTPDGETLVLWAKAPEPDQPTLLYFHGNAGGLANRAQRFDRILRRGYGLIALAYRGSTGSTGKPSQDALMADARLVLDQLTRFTGTRDGRVIYYGESLGTGVAVALAQTHPPAGLILEAPYTSIRALAQAALPIYPVTPFLRSPWDTLAKMPDIRVPLLILHGTKDQVVPFEMGQAVFTAAASPDKTLVQAKGAAHHALWSVSNQRQIYRFVDRIAAD